tara:strand:+ start:386 stop:796 length:411 start_codon:yes stop_codon:yes gene_type:complete
MSYILELSLNYKKTANTTTTNKNIIDIALKYKCFDYYSKHEFSGRNRTIQKNNCIYTFTFPENKEILCEFIRIIRKIRGVYIENIVYENTTYNLIYASKKYLNIMEKEFALKYLQQKKDGIIYKNNPTIINAINKT